MRTNKLLSLVLLGTISLAGACGGSTSQVSGAGSPIEPPASTTPEAARYRPSSQRSLGLGLVVGTSPDGTAALVAAEDPDTGADGCEGTPAPFLFTVPLDGGARARAVPGTTPVAGQVIRGHGGNNLAIVSVCEEFLSELYVAQEEPGGGLSGVKKLDRELYDGLIANLAWSRDGKSLLGVVSDTGEVVRISPSTGIRETLATGQRALQAGELADGRLVVLSPEPDTRESKVRVGSVEHRLSAFGFAISPNGRELALYGEGGLYLLGPEGTPRPLVSGWVRAVTWAPDGRALAHVSDGALRVVTTDGAVTEVVAKQAVTAGFFTPDGKGLVFTTDGFVNPFSEDQPTYGGQLVVNLARFE